MNLFADGPLFSLDAQGNVIAMDPAVEETLRASADMPQGAFGAAFLKMILSLVFLIALMAITVWVLRRLIQNRLQKGSDASSIRVIEKRMISPKTMLYLVEIDNQKILLAESHLEIRRLHNLAEPSESNSISS